MLDVVFIPVVPLARGIQLLLEYFQQTGLLFPREADNREAWTGGGLFFPQVAAWKLLAQSRERRTRNFSRGSLGPLIRRIQFNTHGLQSAANGAVAVVRLITAGQQRETASVVMGDRSLDRSGAGGDVLSSWAEKLSGRAGKRATGSAAVRVLRAGVDGGRQDPVTSRARQLQQALMLAAGAGGDHSGVLR